MARRSHVAEEPLFNARGQRVCGAKSRRNPTGRCHNTAIIPPSQRCRMHGGKSKGGSDAASFKHGRYSTWLPSNLAAKYQAALADPSLLELREDAALVDARIQLLLASWATSEASAPDALERAREARTAMQEANEHDDAAALKAATGALDTALDAAPADLAAIRLGGHVKSRQ